MIESVGDGWIRFIFDQVVDGPVFLVGDFNQWDESSHPLERREDGTHQTILRLPPGEYEFKYKCGKAWFNDGCAHKYVPNCWGSENSVAVVEDYAHQPKAENDRPVAEKSKRPSRPGTRADSGGASVQPGS